MKLKLILFIHFFTFTQFATSQNINFETEWKRTFPKGIINSIIKTMDGGYAIVGCSYTQGINKKDGLLLKLDDKGIFQWDKIYADWGKINSLIQTQDGSYILTGYKSSKDGVWLIKTNDNGNIIWNKTYGGSYTDYYSDRTSSVILNNDGGYTIIAQKMIKKSNSVLFTPWIITTDENGKIQWSKTYGIENDQINSIIHTTDGGYAMVGKTSSKAHNKGNDGWLIKTDKKGNVTWDKTYGNFYDDDEIKSLITTLDGDFALVGKTRIIGEEGKVWFIKVDTKGNIIWNRKYENSQENQANSIICFPNVGYVLGCAQLSKRTVDSLSNNYKYLICTDKNGNIIEQKRFEVCSGIDNTISLLKTHENLFTVLYQSNSDNYKLINYKFFSSEPSNNIVIYTTIDKNTKDSTTTKNQNNNKNSHPDVTNQDLKDESKTLLKEIKYAASVNLKKGINKLNKLSSSDPPSVIENKSVTPSPSPILVSKSDIDDNIPINHQKNKNTFALIIANENYKEEGKVSYALNDGRKFNEYCIKTLGIDPSNIKYIEDATVGGIKKGVKWMKDIIEVKNGSANVIFYYAGHGVPDEKERTAYLLPVDASTEDTDLMLSLSNLYEDLTQKAANQIVIFLDACFSGTTREGESLSSTRGVKVKVKNSVPRENTIVFSASTGEQTAAPYEQQQHGLFTYFLLKKIQETNGNITLEELGNFVINQVQETSIITNSKKQTPQIIVSPNLDQTWKTKKLIF